MEDRRQAMASLFAAAEYRVFGADGTAIDSRVGVDSAAIAALLAARGVHRAVLLSACNPQGRALAAADNARRHAALCARAVALGWPHLAAEGASPDCRWIEPGLLLFGRGAADAARLAREFDQAAWLEYDAHGRAALCWASADEDIR